MFKITALSGEGMCGNFEFRMFLDILTLLHHITKSRKSRLFFIFLIIQRTEIEERTH